MGGQEGHGDLLETLRVTFGMTRPGHPGSKAEYRRRRPATRHRSPATLRKVIVTLRASSLVPLAALGATLKVPEPPGPASRRELLTARAVWRLVLGLFFLHPQNRPPDRPRSHSRRLAGRPREALGLYPGLPKGLVGRVARPQRPSGDLSGDLSGDPRW